MIVPSPAGGRRAGVLASAAAVLALVIPSEGQFRGGVDLVEVYATVTDDRGRPITGLTAADFRVAEDGRPQTIAAFAEGDVPLAVAVAVDHSFSLSPRQLAQVVAGAARVHRALGPGGLGDGGR